MSATDLDDLCDSILAALQPGHHAAREADDQPLARVAGDEPAAFERCQHAVASGAFQPRTPEDDLRCRAAVLSALLQRCDDQAAGVVGHGLLRCSRGRGVVVPVSPLACPLVSSRGRIGCVAGSQTDLSCAKTGGFPRC